MAVPATLPGISESPGQPKNGSHGNVCGWRQLAAGDGFVGHQVAVKPSPR